MASDFPNTPSCICTAERLLSPAFQRWIDELHDRHLMHRKLWELCFISQVLHEHGMLQPGRRGLVFGVGRERLPSYFAACGCQIVATDLPAHDHRAQAWSETNQWTASLEELNAFGLCDEQAFRERVSYEPVDMNVIPEHLRRGEFDFTWSACALDHCGSVALGQAFLQAQMACLRPGGVAVHTTEFNVSSATETIDHGSTSYWLQSHVDDLCARLRDLGHVVGPVDYSAGGHALNRHVDQPPYHEEAHLRYQVGPWAMTSVGLVLVAGPQPEGH